MVYQHFPSVTDPFNQAATRLYLSSSYLFVLTLAGAIEARGSCSVGGRLLVCQLAFNGLAVILWRFCFIFRRSCFSFTNKVMMGILQLVVDWIMCGVLLHTDWRDHSGVPFDFPVFL